MNGSWAKLHGIISGNMAPPHGMIGVLRTGEQNGTPVSYTHLDVYKRQVPLRALPGTQPGARSGSPATENAESCVPGRVCRSRKRPLPIVPLRSRFFEGWKRAHVGRVPGPFPHTARRTGTVVPLPPEGCPGAVRAGIHCRKRSTKSRHNCHRTRCV